MSGRRRIPAGCFIRLLPAIMLASGCGPLAAQTQRSDRAPGMSVSVTPARTMCFEDRVNVSGTIVGRHEIDVGPDHEGLQVGQALVDVRDEVTPGQVMARLAPAEGQTVGAQGPETVRSPVAGIVEVSNATAGVPASMRRPLFQILEGGDLDLLADVTEAELATIALGQTVTVTPLGAADLSGLVQTIAPGVSPTSQLGRIRVAISGGHDVRVGTFAHGLIVVGRRCGLGVPASAVMYPAEGPLVHVVVGHQVQALQVRVGLPSGTDLEILSGLKESDVVVVRAGPFLRDGEEVDPVPLGTPVMPAAP